jgi:hypothetical protein
LHFLRPAIKCYPCVAARQHCTFLKVDWGIKVWPKVEPSEDGISRRDVNSSRKKGGRKSVAAIPMAKSVSEGDAGSSRAAKRARGSRRFRVDSTPPSQPDSDVEVIDGSVSEGERERAGTGTRSLGDRVRLPSGRLEQIFLEDFAYVEALFNSETQTAMTLWTAFQELSLIRSREQASLNLLTQTVTLRVKRMNSILVRLENAVREEMEEMEEAEREELEDRDRPIAGEEEKEVEEGEKGEEAMD